VAEREGFEPPIRLPVCRISSAVLSTTQPPLHGAETGRKAWARLLIQGLPDKQERPAPPVTLARRPDGGRHCGRMSRLSHTLRGSGLALLLVALTTGAGAVLARLTGLVPDTIIYLIPVLIAALRWGIGPAVVAAVTGVAASAFFLYEPLLSFAVQSQQQILHLALFLLVAVVTGELVRRLNAVQRQAETEMFREALLSSVTHELRTPLAAILGAATVLQTTPALSDQRRHAELVRVIREEAERLDHDIQNLLDASRISSQGVTPRREWSDPADILNSALARCQRRLASHAVSLEMPYDLPLIETDSVLVEHALVQILDNAAKYSPPGTPIKLSAVVDDATLHITVTDSGEGLSESEMPRIWERFFRGVDKAARTAGSGLGLWIANAFVRANGGTLRADSAGAGQGTAVTITLPIPRRTQPVARDDDA
jgi:K+-sensing histidine kinase KdpD